MRYLAAHVADEAKQAPKTVKKRRWPRRLAIGLAVTMTGIGGVWYGIHNIPGFGPALADGVRAVLGPSVVAWIEDTAYGIADDISYDGSKGLYMLRANGNQNAMVSRDSERGPRGNATGRRIEFIPSRSVVFVDRATGASGGQ